MRPKGISGFQAHARHVRRGDLGRAAAAADPRPRSRRQEAALLLSAQAANCCSGPRPRRSSPRSSEAPPSQCARRCSSFFTFGYVAGDRRDLRGHASARARHRADRRSSRAGTADARALLELARRPRDVDARPEDEVDRSAARRARRGGANPSALGRAARRVPERRDGFGGGAGADGAALVAAGQDVHDRLRRSALRRTRRGAQHRGGTSAPSITSRS